MSTYLKDPAKVRGGRASALKRWGIPKTIRLDELDAHERAFIIELVEVAKRHAKADAGAA